MDTDALGKIYSNLHLLLDDFTDFPETEEAENNFWKFVKKNVLSNREPDIEFENVLLDVAHYNQKQGFIYGFKYAISLMFNDKFSI